jgi:GntR family transcriptional regulator
VEQIRFHVASGLLEPGEEMPSTRTLSAKLGVNPMTISKALGLLEADGVLERRPGRPHVVPVRQGAPALATRLEQLEQSLRPVVTKARQMNLKTDEAIAVFRTLLDNEADEER